MRDFPDTPPIGSFSANARTLLRVVRSLGKPSRYEVSTGGDYLWLSANGAQVAAEIDRGEWPRYRGWSPPWESKMVCPSVPLVDVISGMSNDPKCSPLATLVFSPEQQTVTVSNSALSIEETIGDCTAGMQTLVRLSFNSEYLADCLTSVRSDRALFRFAADPTSRPKPVMIADARDARIWNLLMPTRAG